MAINTIITIADSSSLTLKELVPFEQKIQKALAKTFGQNTDINLQCNINVDSSISPSVEKQFYKVGKNIYIGVTEGSNVDASMRRAFVFECIAINDEKAKQANRIVLLISTLGFVKSRKDIQATSQWRNEEDVESPISYEAVVPKYSLDKVILDGSTKCQLARAIALIRNQKLIFDTWGFREVDPNTKAILCFFGAPGTGKTMCAHAMAKELGKKIMIASYASIESKWVGEGPKNMRKIFKDAADQDALLFFDEADSFLSKRVSNAETGSDKHYNRMSNEMFQLLEDFDGVVIFATNLVADFDKAFKSRILSFIEFTLPDTSTRAKLIQTMIPSKLPLDKLLPSNYLQSLANASDGFSGREIRKALLTSLSEGACNGINTFGLDDLLIGFSAVNEERMAIEESASRERNVISDFIESSNQNNAIVDFCHWTLDQQEIASDSSKETLYKICRILNSEMPDLTISYRNKDLKKSAETILNAGRTDETIIYIAQIITNSNLSMDDGCSVMVSATTILDSSKIESAQEYLESLNKLLVK
jgi:SpoVK/Ycf46/Vps4 family AAA+-type ATPase